MRGSSVPHDVIEALEHDLCGNLHGSQSPLVTVAPADPNTLARVMGVAEVDNSSGVSATVPASSGADLMPTQWESGAEFSLVRDSGFTPWEDDARNRESEGESIIGQSVGPSRRLVLVGGNSESTSASTSVSRRWRPCKHRTGHQPRGNTATCKSVSFWCLHQFLHPRSHARAQHRHSLGRCGQSFVFTPVLLHANLLLWVSLSDRIKSENH